jgi:hypothetical protein
MVSSDMVPRAHHVTRHNTPIHNIIWTASTEHLSEDTRKAPEEGNVMSKHVATTIHNK